jgi:tetratricopeptide (TPR) repeat protein
MQALTDANRVVQLLYPAVHNGTADATTANLLSDAYTCLARLDRAAGDFADGRAEATNALQLNPRNADALYVAGLLRRHSGDRAGAIYDLQLAARIYRQQGDAIAEGGLAQAQQALRTLGAAV